MDPDLSAITDAIRQTVKAAFDDIELVLNGILIVEVLETGDVGQGGHAARRDALR